MSRMVAIPLAVTTAGGAGTSAGTSVASRVICGLVHGVILDAPAGAPATTDVTVRTKGSSGSLPSYTIWNRADAGADVAAFPAVLPVSTANAAITNAHRPVPVADALELFVDQADNGQLFKAWVLVEEMAD